MGPAMGVAMKRLVLVVATAASSALLLAACGGGGGGGGSSLGTMRQMLSSILGSKNVQLSISGTFSGAGSGKVESILKKISLDVYLSGSKRLEGSALSSSNYEVIMKASGNSAVDLRKVGKKVYVLANLTALAGIPGMPDSAELSAASVIFGGKWYEISQGLVNEATSGITKAAAKDHASVATYEAATAAVIGYLESLHAKKLHNGYSISSTVNALDAGLYGVLHTVVPSIKPPGHQPGTYEFTITGSGTTAHQITVTGSGPNGKGNATASMTIGITHNGTSIAAPSSSTLVTPQLIQQLESGG